MLLCKAKYEPNDCDKKETLVGQELIGVSLYLPKHKEYVPVCQDKA